MTCARDNPGRRSTNSVSCRDTEIHRRWLFPTGALSWRAMAAGVTSRLWEMGDIVDVLEAWEAKGERPAAVA
jgi:hypothetical protein